MALKTCASSRLLRLSTDLVGLVHATWPLRVEIVPRLELPETHHFAIRLGFGALDSSSGEPAKPQRKALIRNTMESRVRIPTIEAGTSSGRASHPTSTRMDFTT